jgi:hypothetical protein
MAKSMVLYGDSGCYKTTNLGFAAKYLYAKHHKPVRLVTAENHQSLDPLIEVGIIHLVEFSHDIRDPLPFLTKLSRGFWPNEKGILVYDPKALSMVCAYLCEGLTSWSDIVLKDSRDKKRKISEEAVGAFTEDGISFAANARSHFGFAQNVLLDRITEFGNLPVDRVIFSAHEAKGEEADSRNPIRGPGLAGKAATDSVPRKVGSCLHFEAYAEEKMGPDKIQTTTTKVRAFFVSHPDPKFPQTLYKCKARVPAERFEELMQRFPGGYFTPTLTNGLDEYLRAEDELGQSSAESIRNWKEKVDAQK